MEWNPGNAFTTRTGHITHVMFSLILGYEPDERLLRAELISIVAAMITRLADPEYEDHSVVPVSCGLMLPSIRKSFLFVSRVRTNR
jgi:hypothetical protein